MPAVPRSPVDGRQVVVRHRKMLLRPAGPAALHAKLIEREKRLALVDQVEVDIEQLLALRRDDDHMVGPDFFEQGSCGSLQHPEFFQHRTVLVVVVLHPLDRVGIADRSGHPEIERQVPLEVRVVKDLVESACSRTAICSGLSPLGTRTV